MQRDRIYEILYKIMDDVWGKCYLAFAISLIFEGVSFIFMNH